MTMRRPPNYRVQRAMRVTEWADKPFNRALRLYLRPGPFKALRRIPFKVLLSVLEIQISATERIAR